MATKSFHNKKPSARKPVPKTGSSLKNFTLRNELLVIALSCMLLYCNTFFSGYALDDALFITDNALTKKGFDGMADIMSKDAFYGVFGDDAAKFLPGGRYRPLSQIMFAAEYEMFGPRPFAGHLINVILYTLVCLILFKVLEALFGKKPGKWYLSLPFLATMIFALHPLHTEVVANIKGRDELLSLLFSLIALWLSLKYFKNKRINNLVLLLPVFMLALLSKENALTFIAVIPLTLFVFTKTPFKNYLILALPLIITVIVYFVIRFSALGFITNDVVNEELLNDPFLYATFWQKLGTVFYTWGRYLILLIFPHPLTHDYYPYHIQLIGLADYRSLISLAVYLALGVYAMIRIFKKDIIAYGILLYLITFSISSNLVFNIGTFMNERFMFVPLLGFAIILAYAANRWSAKARLLPVVKTLLVLLLLLYSVKTFTRNFVWKNSYTLFTTDVKTSENSAKCNVGAGEMLIRSINDQTPPEKKTEIINASVAYFEKGISIHPRFKAAWLFLGYAQHLTGDYKNSRLSLIRVFELEPGNSDAANYLDNAARESYKTGNFKQAEDNFKTLIAFMPEKGTYINLLAEVYANTGKADSALIILNDLITREPSSDQAWNKLGEIYGRIYGDLEKSLIYLQKAYELNPENASTLKNLGTAYGMAGKFELSLRYLLEANAITPDDKDIIDKIALSYKNTGDEVNAGIWAAKAAAVKQ